MHVYVHISLHQFKFVRPSCLACLPIIYSLTGPFFLFVCLFNCLFYLIIAYVVFKRFCYNFMGVAYLIAKDQT